MIIRRIFNPLIFIIAIIIAPKCHSPSNDLSELKTYINFKLQRDHMPGLAIAIVRGQMIAWSKGFGYSDLEHQKKVTAKTIFGTASITKSFTAAAIFQLYEKNLLNIDDPVNDYLPFQVKSSWQPSGIITIRQVLSHTSGISNGPSLWRIVHCGDSPVKLSEWAEGYFIPKGRYWHPEGNFERWPPEKGFQYSNAGYGLLAYIVERVSGLPFYEYIRLNMLEPLEMYTASLRVADLNPELTTRMYEWGDLWGFEYDLIEPGVDTTNLVENKRYTPICTYNDPVYGAGSLYSSVEELCNFLIMVKDGGIYKGKQLLEKKSIDLMFSGQVNPEYLPPWFVDFGMGGYSMRLDNNEVVWGHTGADPGMSSIMFFNREIDLGVVVLANRFFDIRDLISWTFAEGFRAFGDYNIIQSNSNWSLYCGRTKHGYRKKRTVTIRVHSKNVQDNEQIYINGNHHKIGGWISKGIPLPQSDDSTWSQKFAIYDSTKLIFRITRGSWDTKEVLSNGTDPKPYILTVKQDTILTFNIAAWKDRYSD